MRGVFPFRFEPPYRVAGLWFGVTPDSTMVELDDEELLVRFGPWRLHTTVDNVTGCTETGPFSRVKTLGPPRLSLRDRGITFATNSSRGLCICFDEPVPAIEPTGRLRHPAVTVTVADPEELHGLLMGARPSQGA